MPVAAISTTDLTRLPGVLRTVLGPAEHGEPAAWGEALCRDLGALVPGAMIGFLRVTADGPYTHTPLPLDDQVAYVRHWARLDVAAALQRERRLAVAHRWSLVPRAAIRGTPFHEEFLRPRRLEDAYWVNTFDGAGLRHRLFFNFERELAAAERARLLALLGVLAPAFAAGTAQLDRHGADAAALHRTLDAAATPLELRDALGRTVHRNPALGALLAADPERARLEGALHAAAAAVGALARRPGRDGARAARPVAPAVAPAVAHAVATAAGRYRVRASLTPGATAATGPLVLVEVEAAPAAVHHAGHPLPGAAADGPRPGDPAIEAARLRFGLTAQETAVARLMAARRSDAEIGAALGISPHTARTHAERVRRKLGVARRTEVAARLAELR